MKELIKRVERKQKINRNKKNLIYNEISNKSSLSSRNCIKTLVDNENEKKKENTSTFNKFI